MAANEATGHPSLRKRAPPVANLANRDERDTANHTAEDNHQVYHQYNVSRQISSKTNVLLANAYNADL